MYKKLMLIMIPVLFLSVVAFNVKSAAPTVNIGVLYAKYLTQGGGGFNGHGGTYDGAQLAANEINAAGGINVGGTKQLINLDFQDEGAYNPLKGTYDTAIAEASIQKMLGDSAPTPKNQFIIGGFRTETTQAALTTLALWNGGGNTPVPYFIAGSATTALINGSTPTGQWVFRVTPVNDNFLVYTIFDYLAQYLLPQKLAPMYANSTYPADAPGKVRFAVIAEQLTWTSSILYLLTAPPSAGPSPPATPGYNYFLGPNATTKGVMGTPFPGYIAVTPGVHYDFSTIVSTLKSQGVHLIITVFTMPEVNDLLHAIVAANMQAMVVGIDVPGQQQSHWADTGGTATVAAECQYECLLCWSGTGTPVVPGKSEVFWKNFLTYTAGIPDGGGAFWPMYTASGAYDAIYGLKDAIEKAGTTDPNALLPFIKGTDRVSVAGQFKYANTTRFTKLGSLLESPNDEYSDSTGINWTQVDSSPYGWARSQIVQWVQNTTAPPSPYPNVGSQMNVVSPILLTDPTNPAIATALPYTRKTLIPPAMYELAPWDINFDGKVNIADISKVATAFFTTPGDKRWNMEVDVNTDGKIDIRDIAGVAVKFGRSAPQWPLP